MSTANTLGVSGWRRLLFPIPSTVASCGVISEYNNVQPGSEGGNCNLKNFQMVLMVRTVADQLVCGSTSPSISVESFCIDYLCDVHSLLYDICSCAAHSGVSRCEASSASIMWLTSVMLWPS